MPQIFKNYVNLSADESLIQLKSNLNGLSPVEAQSRLSKYGPNELKTSIKSLWQILVGQFKSVFVYLLLIAGIITFLISEHIDAIFIFAFCTLNITIGTFQEYKAEKNLRALHQKIRYTATVVRGGHKKKIDKADLVPGDIVFLESGDLIPADLRLLSIDNLTLNESSLTGESQGVVKTTKALAQNNIDIFSAFNIAFAGTGVLTGTAVGLAIATSCDCQMGAVSQLTNTIEKHSVYGKEILDFSSLIIKVVVATVIVIFIASLIIKGAANLKQLLIFCLVLIVSLIPEALPVIVTLTLSKGAARLTNKRVLTKRLSAIEDLGNIEILCADKTGTITKNRLALAGIKSTDKKRCLLYTWYANQELQEPLNAAVSQYVEKHKIKFPLFTVLETKPFDFVKMHNLVRIQEKDGEEITIIRGIAEKVLTLTNLNKSEQSDILTGILSEEAKGRRALVIAQRPSGKRIKYDFVGYLLFDDPLKDTAALAIQEANRLKIQVKIISGDSPAVVGFIAHSVGLIPNPKLVITGVGLSKCNPAEFDAACLTYNAFARITPEQKLQIIASLQKKYRVAYMGEGMNDAPAIKAADVGIAVDGASDVSRAAADIVLLGNDLNVVTDGVDEGRIIFSNINKYIKCALSTNFGNFYSIAILSLILPFLPMLPTQILLENILSDLPLIAVADDNVDKQEVRRPHAYNLKKMLPLIITFAVISSVFDFIFFFIFRHKSPAQFQTLWFIMSLISEMFIIYSLRSHKLFFKAQKPGKILAILSILIIIFAITVPFTLWGQNDIHFAKPSLIGLAIILTMLIAYMALNEIAKSIYYKKFFNRQTNN